MAPRRILIVGGSTRAAADSVRRAGAHPICADMFADLDLRQSADVIPVRQYPHSLPDDVKRVRADGWFYTGALENQPEIIAGIQAQNANCGPLLGTSPDALRLVRDPHWLIEKLRDAGIQALNVRASANPPEPDGNWLQKPLASAGGRSIRIWDRDAARIPFAEPCYFQQRITGQGLSSIFYVEANHIEWLGGASELQCEQSSRAPSSFAYCGSCGPLHRINFHFEKSLNRQERMRVRSRRHGAADSKNRSQSRLLVVGSAAFQSNLQNQLDKIARALVDNVPGLRGLVGLDFRLNNGTVWLTEANPRFTASIEVLEFALGRSLIFGRNTVELQSTRPPDPSASPRVVAKQILYAQDRLTVGDLSRFIRSLNPWQIPAIADIPMPDSVVEAGWPICTVFAAAASSEQVRQQLDERVRSIQSLLSRS